MHYDLSRRTFLQASLFTLGAVALPLGAFAQEPKKRPVVGSGEHTYEVYHDWLTPPDNLLFGDTHGVAVDSQGRIYIAHTVNGASVGTDAVVVYDPNGKFIRSLGSDFKGGAHGLDLRKEGSEEFLYHCDTNRRLVVKTTLDGKEIWQRGTPTASGVYPEGTSWCPTNVAFDPNGDVIVGDGYGSHFVHRFGKDGEHKGVLIRPGAEAGLVREPHGLWLDTRGGTPKLVVADRGNNRLQEFTLDGKHIGFVTEGMRRPCHLHYNGDLALVPDLDSVVTILDKNNKVVASLGDGHPTNLRGAPRDKFAPGKFIHPHSARWINKRDILVVEWVPIGRVTLLNHVGS